MTLFCSDHIAGKMIEISFLALLSLREDPAAYLNDQTCTSLAMLVPFTTFLLQTEIHDKSVRKVLHTEEIHKKILDVCRLLSYFAHKSQQRLPSHAAFSLRLRSYIHRLLNISVVISRPAHTATTIHWHGHDYPITDVLSTVWQSRYEGWLRSSDHASWISSVMHDAFVAITATSTGLPDEEAHLTTIVNCLSVMSELDWLIAGPSPEVCSVFSWAITHEAILLRHSALKLIGRICYHDWLNPVRGLVKGMGGIARFSEVLASAGPALSDDSTRAPSCYLWIQAYLDIVCTLAYDEEWIGHVMSDGHADRCLAFAGYLATNTSESRWDVDVATGGSSTPGHEGHSPTFEFIGWDSDPEYEDFAPTSRRYYKNPYIRDVWRSLVEILVRCNRHHPDFIAQHHRDTPHAPDLRPIVACVAWQIYDTHPLSIATGPLVAAYTREVMASFPAPDVEIHDGFQERVHDVLNALPTAGFMSSGVTRDMSRLFKDVSRRFR